MRKNAIIRARARAVVTK